MYRHWSYGSLLSRVSFVRSFFISYSSFIMFVYRWLQLWAWKELPSGLFRTFLCFVYACAFEYFPPRQFVGWLLLYVAFRSLLSFSLDRGLFVII